MAPSGVPPSETVQTASPDPPLRPCPGMRRQGFTALGSMLTVSPPAARRVSSRTTVRPQLAPALDLDEAARLRLAVVRLAWQIRRNAHAGVTPSQLSALVTLERHGPLQPAQLADHEHIGCSTAILEPSPADANASRPTPRPPTGCDPVPLTARAGRLGVDATGPGAGPARSAGATPGPVAPGQPSVTRTGWPGDSGRAGPARRRPHPSRWQRSTGRRPRVRRAGSRSGPGPVSRSSARWQRSCRRSPTG